MNEKLMIIVVNKDLNYDIIYNSCHNDINSTQFRFLLINSMS